MTLPEMKKFRWNYLALAFAIPFTLMLCVMFITSAEPFGEYLMLYSDQYHQYFPFFKEFRQALLSGESLLWNWSTGLGMDYLGLISYYLASPLNLLSVLVPEQWVLEYFHLLTPIKLGLASLFFAIMLKKLYGKDDLALSLFGSFYGMCAWALGYLWNIMWLDTFALLPLVVLGMVLMLRDRKCTLYTVALFLAVFSNYYVGFFVCIFIFLLFFCYELCRFKSIWRFITDFFCIGIFTVLAIGMTAILELPALSALQDTYSSVNQFPKDFATNILDLNDEAVAEAVNTAKEAWKCFKDAKELGEETYALWWDAIQASLPPVLIGMKQVACQMGGGQSLTYMDGLPNLYCGIFPVALAVLFLLSGKVKLRDKFCCVLLLVFFMTSFIVRQLDYIWHGFHFPNQIPYRFSFLYSFVLLYMAYRAWLLRDEFPIWQIVTAGVLSVLLLCLDPERLTDLAYVILNFSFLALFTLLMVYRSPRLHGSVRKAAAEVAIPAEIVSKSTTIEPVCVEEIQAEEPSNGDPITVEAEPSPEVAETNDAPPSPAQPFAEELAPERAWLPTPEIRNRSASLAMAGIMVLELILQLVNFTSNYSIGNWDYPKGGEDAESIFRYLSEKEKEIDFFRTEVTHAQTLNDGALNGYNGLSAFTSSANVKTTEFMEALGYAGRNNWNRYCWEESSPVANLFLNLKYMVERDRTPAENSYFDPVHSYHKITLMENTAYLPLGFLAESPLAEVDFAESSGFTLQNKLFRAATGITSSVWDWVPKDALTVTSTGDITLNSVNIAGYTSFKSGAGSSELIYTYNITQEGFMCLDLTLYAQKNFSVRHNGSLLYSESYTLPCTMAVCDVAPGDTVEVRITCPVNTNSAVQIKAVILDEEVFRAGYEILSASTLQLTEFSTTYISGVIRCDRDGLLYTSIPQCGNERTEKGIGEDGKLEEAYTSPEGNWVAYVDGEKADITLVGDVMVCLNLTEGIHTVEFRYENKAFQMGAAISGVCFLAFAAITGATILYRRKKTKKDAE